MDERTKGDQLDMPEYKVGEIVYLKPAELLPDFEELKRSYPEHLQVYQEHVGKPFTITSMCYSDSYGITEMMMNPGPLSEELPFYVKGRCLEQYPTNAEPDEEFISMMF